MLTTRRQILSVLGAAAAAQLAPSRLPAQTAAPAGPFVLPPLGYAFDALEPYIDAQTMQIHHGRHHAAYVDNLNKAVASFPDLAKRPVEDLLRDLNAIPEAIRTAVRNHGGGHANHVLYWRILSPGGSKQPAGELAKAIDQRFGSFNSFQDQITRAATGVFGSGWAWLVLDQNRQLSIVSTPNQDTPISTGQTPLLGIDVWEHAYYLKYQNRRADYLAAFHKAINWDPVSDHYSKLAK
ncbi:MAG TPA: superoxide dismutase [Bryobacteraceae bacterium]|nr:superoxide dismutase [Bryobacteraceae bacterium]